MRWSLDGSNLMAIRDGSTIFEILATKDVFFKVYEEVLGLLDFLHFFGITFTLEDETPLIDFQIKKTNPWTCFSNSKNKLFQNGRVWKIIHYPWKKHSRNDFLGASFCLFRSPRGPKKNMNLKPNPSAIHLVWRQHHLANELTFAALRGVSWGIQVVSEGSMMSMVF